MIICNPNCNSLLNADLPEMSMAYSLAFQYNESQKFDSLPWTLSCQERDSGLFPYPSQPGKAPAQWIFSKNILNLIRYKFLLFTAAEHNLIMPRASTVMKIIFCKIIPAKKPDISCIKLLRCYVADQREIGKWKEQLRLEK